MQKLMQQSSWKCVPVTRLLVCESRGRDTTGIGISVFCKRRMDQHTAVCLSDVVLIFNSESKLLVHAKKWENLKRVILHKRGQEENEGFSSVVFVHNSRWCVSSIVTNSRPLVAWEWESGGHMYVFIYLNISNGSQFILYQLWINKTPLE